MIPPFPPANLNRSDASDMAFVLAMNSALEACFLACIVCQAKTPHRLLGILDGDLEGDLKMFKCGVCGTTHSIPQFTHPH